MDDERIVDIVAQALELAGEGRKRFLDQECGTDLALRREVESLLEEEGALSDGFLDTPAPVAMAERMLADATLPNDETQVDESRQAMTQLWQLPAGLKDDTPRLGPYMIRGKLGEGGMGVVYLGEQEEPVRRQVAIKLLSSSYSHHRRKRFAAEGQALARLNHPNVATLYEVGSTEDDHPYVVMELVEGKPINQWCDEHRLGLEARLRLFIGVCAGVRHAHEKGILHRDIKPSNVLVTEVDGRPLAKVIDFGIARGLGERNLIETQLTQDGLVGSPGYMSPEAATLGHGAEVDTRTDVHSLGVLLYELMVGVLPFPVQGQSMVDILLRLGKEDMPAATQRYAGLEEERQREIARLRGLDSRRLQRRVAGDLDAILLKATARERENRYSSPSELASDVQRHLDSQPIAARVPSRMYLMRRFVRRRSGLVATVALLFLALGLGVIARTVEARRANQEARRAQEALAESKELSRFLTEMFRSADPERVAAEEVSVLDLLADGSERLLHGEGGPALSRIRLLLTVADLYTKMALLDRAEALAREAVRLNREVLPRGRQELFNSLTVLGIALRRQGRLEEAEALFSEAVGMAEGDPGADPLKVALAHNHLGNLRWSQKRYDEAVEEHRQALALRQQVLPTEHADVAESYNNLGAALQALKRYEEAATVIQKSVDLYAQLLRPDHPQVGAGLNNLALVQQGLGQLEEAAQNFRQAIVIWEASYGVQHPTTDRGVRNLVKVLGMLFRHDEAVIYRRRALEFEEWRVEQGRGSQARLANRVESLAVDLWQSGDREAAVVAYRRALAMREDLQGKDDPRTHRVRYNLGLLLAFQGSIDEGRRHVRQAVDGLAATQGATLPATLAARSVLARIDSLDEQVERAVKGYQEIISDRRAATEVDEAELARELMRLALAQKALDDRDAAMETLQECLAIRERVLGPQAPRVADALYEIGRLHAEAGRQQEALSLHRRALNIRQQHFPTGHRVLRRSEEALAALEENAENTG